MAAAPPKPAVRAAASAQAPGNTPSEGVSLGVGQSFGASGASLISLDWWLAESFGVGFETGFTYRSRDIAVPVGSVTRLVHRVDYAVEPSLDVRWAAVTAGLNRFYLVAGGGPRLDKPDAQTLATGFDAYAGPGIDYHLGDGVSLGAEARIMVSAAKDRTAGIAAGAATVASLHWWFE